jgi:hypothetical protein
MSDQSHGKPSHSDGQIAQTLSISRRTVIRIKQRFVQENLEVALIGRFPGRISAEARREQRRFRNDPERF